jgi:hypothetical protein
MLSTENCPKDQLQVLNAKLRQVNQMLACQKTIVPQAFDSAFHLRREQQAKPGRQNARQQGGHGVCEVEKHSLLAGGLAAIRPSAAVMRLG